MVSVKTFSIILPSKFYLRSDILIESIHRKSIAVMRAEEQKETEQCARIQHLSSVAETARRE